MRNRLATIKKRTLVAKTYLNAIKAELSFYDQSLQPQWVKELRKQIWYRGLRVIGGAFGLYSIVVYGLRRNEILDIINKVLEEGFDNPVQAISYCIGILGIVMIIVDTVISLGLTIKAPYQTVVNLQYLYKTYPDNKLEATGVELAKLGWTCFKGACTLTFGLAGGTTVLTSFDTYLERQGYAPAFGWMYIPPGIKLLSSPGIPLPEKIAGTPGNPVSGGQLIHPDTPGKKALRWHQDRTAAFFKDVNLQTFPPEAGKPKGTYRPLSI